MSQSGCGVWSAGGEEALGSWTSWGKESVDAPRLVQIPSPVQVLCKVAG